jgi:hypothetical protein
MILQAHRDGYLPLESYKHLWGYFNLMYVMGWEAHTLNENNGCQLPISQLDENKKRLNDFPSVSSAARRLNCPKSTLLAALKDGHKTRQGHYWVYQDHEKTTHKSLKEISGSPQ